MYVYVCVYIWYVHIYVCMIVYIYCVCVYGVCVCVCAGPEEISCLMNEFDLNRDGRLAYSEFVKCLQQHNPSHNTHADL